MARCTSCPCSAPTALRERATRDAYFRYRIPQHFASPESDLEGAIVAPASVRFRNPVGGSAGHARNRRGSQTHYATHKQVSPDGPGLFQVHRPLGLLSARLGVYRRELNGVTVYQAYVTWPGPPGGHLGPKTSDLSRAVWCGRSEGALLGIRVALPARLPFRARRRRLLREGVAPTLVVGRPGLDSRVLGFWGPGQQPLRPGLDSSVTLPATRPDSQVKSAVASQINSSMSHRRRARGRGRARAARSVRSHVALPAG